jgi:hypothetical protein
MLSLLLQGFYPCRSGRRSNSALSPLVACPLQAQVRGCAGRRIVPTQLAPEELTVGIGENSCEAERQSK